MICIEMLGEDKTAKDSFRFGSDYYIFGNELVVIDAFSLPQ